MLLTTTHKELALKGLVQINYYVGYNVAEQTP